MESDFKKLELKITELERLLTELRNDYYKDNYASTQVFTKNVDFQGVVTFDSLNPTTSFGLGVTPAPTQGNIATPSGGGTQDTEARNAITSILGVLDTFGFTTP